MGSIYKRGKVYWIKYYRGSKCFRESSKSTKEADAKRLLKNREGEISKGKLPGIYFDRVTFEDLEKLYLQDYELNKKKSVKTAEIRAGHLKGFFEGMRITAITSQKIQSYAEKRLSENASIATVNRELSALRRMLSIGAQQTPPLVDRIPNIPRFKESNIRKGFFEHRDFEALRSHLPEYLKGYATFAYRTGWRKEEISSLTWSQVDRENWIVSLNPGETKNDEGRTVYLDEELQDVFQRQWEIRKKAKTLIPYVFPRKGGKGKIVDFRKAWAHACKDAGIGSKLFHDLRRTAVRNMVRAGIPERVAMQISGHRTRSVFERYNIVSDTDLKLAARKQAEYLKEQSDAMGTILGTIAYLGTKKDSSEADKSLKSLVGDARLERATSGSGDQRSIQLS